MEYKLREVVELTGFSKQVLHAWEQRYGFMPATPSVDGVRLYSDIDVYRLQLLKKCLDSGYRIGELVSLELTELKRIARECDPVSEIPLNDVLAAVRTIDAEIVERRLSAHYATLGPVDFAAQVVEPLMAQVGALWQEGELSIEAEHAVSAIVRTLLGQGLRFAGPSTSKALAIFTTIASDRHEMGALTAAVATQSCGVRALYLGPQLPIDSLAQACMSLKASAIGIGSTIPPKGGVDAQVLRLEECIPSDVEIWLGGAGFADFKGKQSNRTSVFGDFSEYVNAVQRHKVRLVRK